MLAEGPKCEAVCGKTAFVTYILITPVVGLRSAR